MDIIRHYSKPLNTQGITFKLISSIPENNEWKYKLSCKWPINDPEKIDNLLKEFFQVVGDLILDGYDVEIKDDFNFLVKKS
jgi:hypothetical protein